MIKSVYVKNYRGESTILTLTKPNESGFIITSIDGLGPSHANINTTNLSSDDGAIYNSSRVEVRNIVLHLRFLEGTINTPAKINGENTVRKAIIEDIRLLSYKYFPIKKKVTLIFETDQRYVSTEGYVETNEPDIFSNEESTSISILCPDPYFYLAGNYEYTENAFSTVQSKIEFRASETPTKYSNESVSEDLTEFGEIRTETTSTIVYEGDKRIGAIFSLNFSGTASMITLYSDTTGEVMPIDTSKIAPIVGSDIQELDIIEISTVTGNKYAKLIRGGLEYNILNALGKNTDWISLEHGDNYIGFYAESGVTNIQVYLRNKVAYEGI